MSDILINGKVYSGVDTINVQKQGGGTAKYTEGERPSGTIEITENGTHDVSNYASANVNVASSGGKDMLQARVDGDNSCSSLFTGYDGSSLDIKKLDTSNVTTMASMFNSCSNLTQIDLSNLNTSNVENMSNMFNLCSRLTSLDLSNFDTRKTTDMNSMFKECQALKEINLSSFDTSSVSKMNTMFYRCKRLSSLNISNFSVDNVNDISSLFNGCSALTDLDISGFNTSKITNLGYMFYDCKKLVNPIGTIDFYSCTAAKEFITNCASLININLKNIKPNLTIGSGTSYGHLLTVDCLVNTIKELWDYSNNTAHTLTMGSANKEKLASVYVKLIIPTAEQIEADPYIESKMPCEVCASTDEGAMLITDYATLKNWTLA